MTIHSMVGTEEHPTRMGCSQRWYAAVDVAMVGTSWHWQQVNPRGIHVFGTSAPFPTEDDAKEDALSTLGGDEWE